MWLGGDDANDRFHSVPFIDAVIIYFLSTPYLQCQVGSSALQLYTVDSVSRTEIFSLHLFLPSRPFLQAAGFETVYFFSAPAPAPQDLAPPKKEKAA
jgi:hypothetical protein